MEIEIAAWLRGLGLQQYVQVFHDNAIDTEALLELTDLDLEKLGVLLGHRKRILRAVAALNATIATNAPALPETVSPVVMRPTGAERRQVTIMFCDLVGSTPLASRLDPEDLRDVLGAYNASVSAVISQFGGTVNRFLGDGVLICFGHPQAHEDDAERAVRAGLMLLDRIGRMEFACGRLEIRVGIATGLVVIGDLIGTGDAQERGIVGETPNLAFRLQGLASPNTVLIDATTRQLIGSFFEYRDVGPLEAKGFAEKVPVWQVLRPSAVDSRFEALRASLLAPFVGRGEELALMLRLWERAKAGEGQVVQLSGEAGIGKSRITAAMQERLRDVPYTRLRYFCSPHHSGSTLHPFIAHLERAARFAREDTPSVKLDKLVTLLSHSATGEEAVMLFGDLLGLPTDERYPPLELDAQRKRELVLGTAIRHLEGLTRERPVLLVCEDVHWIDSTSLELLEMLADRVPSLSVLVVMTFRPEFQPPWAGRPNVTTLSLSRLDPSETAALVAGVAGYKTLPGEIVDRIVERTDGIPLFIEELTKSLLEGGLLREAHDGYVLDGPMPQLAIPSSLHASLLARLDRLSPVREVAQIGAALGREFSYEIIAAMAPHGTDHLQDALNQLAGAGLVSWRGAPPRASIVFKHALIQDAAYSTLLRSQRQELHARIATTLEDRFPDIAGAEPEILAHHYTQAGLLDAAIEYWLKAGERALRRSANIEAIAHLTRGIELTRSLPTSPERDHRELRLYLALGPAMRAIKGHATEEVLGVYLRARALLRDNATAREQIGVLYGLWIIHFTRWDDAATRELAQEMIRLSAHYHNVEFPTLANALMGNTLWATGAFAPARGYLERSLALCEAIHKDRAETRALHNHSVAALSFLGVTLWPLGFLQQAAAVAEKALARAHQTGHVPLTAMALHNQAYLVASFGVDRDLIGVNPAEVEAYCVEHGVAAYEPWARFWQGVVLARSGDLQLGIDIMRGAMDAAQRIGAGLFRSVQLGHLGTALARLGQRETGVDLLSEAIRMAEQTNARFFLAELYRLRGDLLVELDRPAEAETELRSALVVARGQQARLWELRAATSLANLWATQERTAEARDLLLPVYGWFTEGFDTADLSTARGLLDELTTVGALREKIDL
jgi:class 3 adenylate cyclase/tetratricopeptide (TPR) repeat protein